MEDKQPIWQRSIPLETINAYSRNTLLEHLEIRFTEIGPDFVRATMPIDHRTVQPYGLLHGGANVALAESMGSTASLLCLRDLETEAPVGVEINANHLRSVTSGTVTATCRPIRVGRKIHVWQIDIHDDAGHLTCVSRLTVAVVEKRTKAPE